MSESRLAEACVEHAAAWMDEAERVMDECRSEVVSTVLDCVDEAFRALATAAEWDTGEGELAFEDAMSRLLALRMKAERWGRAKTP